MAGLVPAIHVFRTEFTASKTWMPGTRPGMTQVGYIEQEMPK